MNKNMLYNFKIHTAIGSGRWLVSAVMSMYAGAKAVVRTVYGNSTGSGFEVKVGMHQGSALSPLLFMVTLCNRADHYIFAMWFLSIFLLFFSSPNLSGRRLDVCHSSTHGVALVRI